MSISPINAASLSANLTQFKGQALTSLLDQKTPEWSSGPLAGASADTSFFNRVGDPSADPAASPLDALTSSPKFSNVLDQFSASLRMTSLPTSTTPTALDAAQSFSKPGQNMVTVLNRVEVTFKAQHAELGELRKSLVTEQDAAQHLKTLGAQTPDADIKVALDAFVSSYNAGVTRFAPDVAQGGVLEGSWEATRARFATERDIDYVLNGSEVGLKGGLAALGISTDPNTGLASVDHAQLDTALAKNKGNVAAALASFGGTLVTTVDTLNAADHALVRQMGNLDRAVHWIDDNKADVEKEFGPGAAATPDDAFAKAAASYDAMAQLLGKS